MPIINAHKWTVPFQNYFITAPSFNGGSASFNIELDASLVTTAGEYAVVCSTAQLTNYAGVSAAFSGSTSLAVQSVTPSGSIGDARVISGSTYYCVCVTVG